MKTGGGAARRRAVRAGETVLLACPQWAHDLAYPVVQHLRSTGRVPTVVPGPESPGEVLAALTGRNDSELIVICRIGDVGEEQADALRRTLQRRGVHGGRITSVQLDAAPPSVIVGEIYGELSQDRPALDEITTQKIQEEMLAELTGDVDDDMATRVARAPTRPTARRRATQMGIAPPAQGPGSRPVTQESIDPARPPAQFDAPSNPLLQELGAATEPGPDESLADLLEGDTPHERRVPVFLLLAASALVIVLGALVVVTLPGNEPLAASVREAVDSVGDADAAANAAVVPAVGELEAEPGHGARPADEPHEVEVVDEPGPSVVDIVVEQPVVPTATALESIDVALADELVTRHEGMLAARERREIGDFAGAEAYCETLELGGFEDWRVPTIGELVTLGKGRIVGRKSYWSGTLGDSGGGTRLVWWGKRVRILARPATWPRARAVCVRADDLPDDTDALSRG